MCYIYIGYCIIVIILENFGAEKIMVYKISQIKINKIQFCFAWLQIKK